MISWRDNNRVNGLKYVPKNKSTFNLLTSESYKRMSSLNLISVCGNYYVIFTISMKKNKGVGSHVLKYSLHILNNNIYKISMLI